MVCESLREYSYKLKNKDVNNNEYNFTKIREILQNANTDKLIMMQNLNQIQPYFYDLYKTRSIKYLVPELSRHRPQPQT
jgi:hypothetical protein